MQLAAKLAAMPVAIALMASGPARAADVDFARFLATPAGAAGVAAAVAGLGRCDSALAWGFAHDEATGAENRDHLFVGCQYEDAGDGEMYDKSVVAKFRFPDGRPELDSLTYLP